MPEAAEDDDRLLTDRLFDRLSEAIVGGELEPGAKLSEPQLAQRYGVSRGPLREAIRRLEARKLVARTPRQGVRVIVPSRARIVELFAIRAVLEGLAAKEAAFAASVEDIEALRALLTAHRATLDDPSTTLYSQQTADSDFHVRIARIAGNRLLFDLLCDEYYTLLRFFRVRHQAVPGRARRALTEHERVVEAIAERDGELAELLMRRHIAAAARGIVAQEDAAGAGDGRPPLRPGSAKA